MQIQRGKKKNFKRYRLFFVFLSLFYAFIVSVINWVKVFDEVAGEEEKMLWSCGLGPTGNKVQRRFGHLQFGSDLQVSVFF